LPDLLDMLEGPRRRRGRESVRRAYAAQALANLGDVRAVPALREVALDREEHARRSAVLALGAIAKADDEKTTDVLLHQLHNSRDVATRCVAALSLGRAGSSRAEKALVYAYRKGSLRVRPFAAIGLGLLARHPGHAGATGPLLHDLKNRASPQLLASLCVAVGLAGERRAIPILTQIASDQGTAALRAHAAFALGLIGDRAASAPPLRRILEDTREPELQREAALALGLLGDREALRILNDLVSHGGSAYVQGSAAVAIGRIGGRESVDSLVELLSDEMEPTMGRAMAAVGLGLMLDRSEGRNMARVAADLNWWLFTPTVLEILSIH
jgi:HEAT repeat protein